MLAYTFYETDNRVKRYATTLAKRGDHVDVICLRAEETGCRYEKSEGVGVFRVQKRIHNEKGKFSYLFKLIQFFIKSSLLVSRKHLNEPYDVIHVHNIPDFLVFAAWLPRLTGAKIILDIHDVVPEFYAGKFNSGERSVFYKLLVLVERLSIAFSNQVIISNHLWEKKISARSGRPQKCQTILNYPDSEIFFKRAKKRDDGKIVILYPGSLARHQGLDIAIRAFDRIKEKAPQAEFHIYGSGDSKEYLKRLITAKGLNKRVLIGDSLPIERMAEIMAEADIGIVPKRADTFGNEAFSTKILEFMALGVPVIVSDTSIDKFYFNESIIKFFRSGDELDLAEKMLYLIENKSARDGLVVNALNYMKENSWEIRKGVYLDTIDALTGSRPESKRGLADKVKLLEP